MEVVQLRPGWAVKAIMVIVIASILLRCVSVSAATNHTVGGPSGWDLSSNIPAWSSTTTFRVGDSLVFSYSPIHDVLEVDQVGYATCHTVNPINVYNDGETVVPLTQPGTRFFICGRRGHCAMGLRFRVDVLPHLASNETRRRPRSPPPRRHSPPPSPPPSTQPVLPPVPETPPFEGPPPPPPPAAASPCERSAAAGMVIGDYYNWWVWVPLATAII